MRNNPYCFLPKSFNSSMEEDWKIAEEKSNEINKIIINPHYCTNEEYQDLKNYLTAKSWDWQEVSGGVYEEKYFIQSEVK